MEQARWIPVGVHEGGSFINTLWVNAWIGGWSMTALDSAESEFSFDVADAFQRFVETAAQFQFQAFESDSPPAGQSEPCVLVVGRLSEMWFLGYQGVDGMYGAFLPHADVIQVTETLKTCLAGIGR